MACVCIVVCLIVHPCSVFIVSGRVVVVVWDYCVGSWLYGVRFDVPLGVGSASFGVTRSHFSLSLIACILTIWSRHLSIQSSPMLATYPLPPYGCVSRFP